MPQIGKMCADAQPVDFLGRLDHAQADVGLVQARQLAERLPKAPRAARRSTVRSWRRGPPVRRASSVRRSPRRSTTARPTRHPHRAQACAPAAHDCDTARTAHRACPGESTPTASAVTGQPVSHCTAEPKRFAPQKTRCSQPASASSASMARRRRAISASEKRGYSASRIGRRLGAKSFAKLMSFHRGGAVNLRTARALGAQG